MSEICLNCPMKKYGCAGGCRRDICEKKIVFETMKKQSVCERYYKEWPDYPEDLDELKEGTTLEAVLEHLNDGLEEYLGTYDKNIIGGVLYMAAKCLCATEDYLEDMRKGKSVCLKDYLFPTSKRVKLAMKCVPPDTPDRANVITHIVLSCY